MCTTCPAGSFCPGSGVSTSMFLYVNAANCSPWTDLSGTGNTVTLNNAPALISTSASSEAMVVSPCAMNFNGINQEVTTSTAVAAPTTFSLGVWFTTTLASGRKLVGLESFQTGTITGSGSYDRMMWVGTNGQLYFTGWSGGATVSSAVFVADGLPHYAVGTFDPSTSSIRLYLDGVQVASGTITGAIVNYLGWWRIGGYKISTYTNAGSDGYLTARLYAVQVYSIALSAVQVASNYAALFSSGTLAPGAVLCPAGT